MSLPVWERGLKHRHLLDQALVGESLPVWERGLKLPLPAVDELADWVAPRVGAWIETMFESQNRGIVFRRSPCGSVD